MCVASCKTTSFERSARGPTCSVGPDRLREDKSENYQAKIAQNRYKQSVPTIAICRSTNDRLKASLFLSNATILRTIVDSTNVYRLFTQ